MSRLLPLPLLTLALGVIFLWGYDGLYGQDPYAYFDYATGPLRATLLDRQPLQPFHWPLGFPLPVALTALVTGPAPAAGQIVSLTAGLLIVVFTYLFGAELFRAAGRPVADARHSAALGALLLALSGWTLQLATSILSDTLALATGLGALWAIARWQRARSLPAAAAWLALVGLGLGWSVITRWSQALFLPLALAAAFALGPPPHLRRRLTVSLPAALLIAGAILIAQVVLALRVPAGPGAEIPFAGNFSVQGAAWTPGNWLTSAFFTPDGALRYTLPNLVFYLSQPFTPQYLTPLAAIAALAGAAGLARSAEGRRALALLGGWPLMLLLAAAGFPLQNPRFVFPAVPPLALLAGYGLYRLMARRGGKRSGDSGPVAGPPKAGWLRPAALALTFLLVAVLGLRGFGNFLVVRSRDRAVARFAQAIIPRGAITLSEDVTLTLAHTTDLQPRELYLLTIADLQALLAEDRPIYLLVSVERMEGQWAERPPGVNYRFLRNGPGLTVAGEAPGYTLFRVNDR